MKKKVHSYREGFTLIELLISLSIIAVISAIGFMNLSGHREKLAVELEMEKIVTYLRNARYRAISSEQESSWGVRFVNNINDSDLYYLFKGLSFSTTSIVETRYLSKKTQLLIPSQGSTTDVIFIKNSGFVNNTTTIVIQSKARLDFLGTIKINSAGQINY